MLKIIWQLDKNLRMPAVTMSQIMERWPWPRSTTNSSSKEIIMQPDSGSCQCSTGPPAASSWRPQTAVKLVLWPSSNDSSNESFEQASTANYSKKDPARIKPRLRKWSKLPIRQIPSSLSAKMGWLTGETGAGGGGGGKQPNTAFRSNSFRYERPPPEDDARMLGRRPVKSLSINAHDLATLNDKYESPKDLVNNQPLRQITSITKRGQRLVPRGGVGGQVVLMDSNPVDVVYSDPKDSKLYQMPGADPHQEEVLYKVHYVTGVRESQYCRPYITMRSPPMMTSINPEPMKMSEYEEVNAVAENCVTMITVMPSTMTTIGTGSRSGTTTSRSARSLLSPMPPLEAGDTNSTAPSTRESETSSSEGGSFIIDSAAFYENLNFHQVRSNIMVRTASSEVAGTPDDAMTNGGGPNWSKFGYSQKEVWNWLYTDDDHVNNNNVVVKPRPSLAAAASSSANKGDKAVEVKFTLSEFVMCYRRLVGLNLDGFTEFVTKTLEAIVTTSTYLAQTRTLAIDKHGRLKNNAGIGGQVLPCCKQKALMMVPSLPARSSMMGGPSSQSKTYVRLSMKRPPDSAAGPGAFTCYQTLLDLNRSESGFEEFMPYQTINHLAIDLKVPLDRQEWYHGSITRYEAENALRLHEEGSFLVRNSESSSKDYSLSVKTTRGFMHMKIQERGQGYILGQFSKPFRTIAQMILYYSRNSLPVKGAEHITLKKPICEQLL